jgi:tricorn protease interacting factor F2/3
MVGIAVKGASNPLALDAAKMEIESVSVDGRPSKFIFDKVHSKLKVPGVPRRRSLVEVAYTKRVDDDVIFGLYKSKYGKDYLLVTDLEPAEARTVFPCKDEPVYKAVFRLEVTTETGLSVISNTSVVRKEQVEGGRSKFTFEESPRMSTYLFFLGVGSFEEAKVRSGRVDVIAATRPGQSKNTGFALKVVSAVLADFQNYFDVPYPLKKLHVVALPEYHTGAMENWGAIASRESRVLIDEGAGFRDRFEAAITMTHEVGHMWFGDLVTMKWWDDVWLNESFATLVGYKMVGRLHPEWEAGGQYLRNQTFRGLNADALSTTHPIQVHIRKVEEANHVFDAISYNKGASVLTMLEGYVGEDAFKKGVSDYLKKFSYSNARGEDLWRALGAVSRRPVAKVAAAWITKSGFPIVEAAVTKGGLKLSQTPFRMSRAKARGVWPIPVNMKVDGEDRTFLLEGKSMTVEAKRPSEVLVNAGRRGFYCVLYDAREYGRLEKGFTKLSPLDRAGIMNDLFLFLQAGKVSPELYFRFVTASGKVLDSLTAESVSAQLSAIRAIADEAPIVTGAYSPFYVPLMRRLGLTPRKGEPESFASTRDVLSEAIVEVNRDYATRFAKMFEDYDHVDPNLKTAVVISYAITKGEQAKARLVEMVKSLQSEVDRTRIYAALSSFEDPELVEDALELGISGEVSRSDSIYPLVFASGNPRARSAVWKWITKRYDTVLEIYGGSQQFYLFMAAVIPRCGVGQEAEVRQFLSGRRLKEGGSTYLRTLELLGINSRLRRRLMATEPAS